MVAVVATPLRAQDENEKLATCLTEALTKLATKNDPQLGLVVKADGVSIREHAITIVPVSERVGKMGGKPFSAARFEVTLDGHKDEKLTFGSVGIGDSEEDARATAVAEWYMSFGAALLNALAGKSASVSQNGYAVYPGGMGLRGGAPKDWMDGSDSMHHRILSSLARGLPKPDSAIHTLDLKVAVNPKGAVEGDCRLDGMPAPQVLSILKSLAWPKQATGYLLKQAYVLK